jgi:parallel beta-helix repeat protein
MMRRLKLGLALGPLALLLVMAVSPSSALAATPLPNGFTAAVVAVSGQRITGVINAAGSDVGIYIGPGVHNVTVWGATVSGANDEGILVQDASNVTIEGSTVSGNAVGVDPSLGLTEVKGIVLAGTRNCLVWNNTIANNQHGGISLLDDGPSVVFAPTSISPSPVAGTGNLIIGNRILNNLGDCGIVISAKNPGGGVSYNVAALNTVSDTVSGGVGGIIVAGGAFGPVTLTDNVIEGNMVSGGLLAGIMIHAFGPGVITGTQLIGNQLTNNGAGELSLNTTGIEIYAVPHVGTISGTKVFGNTISGDYYGVWHTGDAGTLIALLRTHGVTVPVGP